MNVLDIIRDTSAAGTTRFSFELLPPLKGDGTRSVFTTVEALSEFGPAFVNITFHRESIKETISPDGHMEWHRVRRRRARWASRPPSATASASRRCRT